MQLPSLLIGALFHIANSFLPLTSPTHLTSIPDEIFHPFYHTATNNANSGYTPSQIRHAYGIDQLSAHGNGHSLAIVEAYHDPHLGSDMETFISTYHLTQLNGLPGRPNCSISAGPHPCLEVSNLSTRTDTGWATETALDTEWSHAIADQADISLIEAKDDSARSLAAALTLAVSKHPTTVSLSWGGSEFEHETDWDPTFAKSMVVAASGDSGSGASFPSTSTNVLAVGGTSLHLDSLGNKTTAESAWSGSGGGESTFVNRPLWQAKNLLGTLFTLRLTPDVAYNADPSNGFSVIDNNHFEAVGGTSAGAPQWAAILALSSHTPSNALVYRLGTGASRTSFFSDITHGANGTCQVLCQTRKGFDTVTGLGSPFANRLVPSL